MWNCVLAGMRPAAEHEHVETVVQHEAGCEIDQLPVRVRGGDPAHRRRLAGVDRLVQPDLEIGQRRAVTRVRRQFLCAEHCGRASLVWNRFDSRPQVLS
jgi:hypothetical protein